jgi:hypothetical protein
MGGHDVVQVDTPGMQTSNLHHLKTHAQYPPQTHMHMYYKLHITSRWTLYLLLVHKPV